MQYITDKIEQVEVQDVTYEVHKNVQLTVKYVILISS